MASTQQAFVRLKPEQPLYNVFPDGLIPVIYDKPTSVFVKDAGMQPVYFTKIEALPRDQYLVFVERIAEKDKVTINEVAAYIEHRGIIAIRESHTTGEVIYKEIQ